VGGGAWATDPAVALPTYFVPQGISADLIATLYGYSREDVDAYAVESQRAPRWPGPKAGSPARSCRCKTSTACRAGRDEHMRADTTLQSLGKLEPSFKCMGEKIRLRRRGAAALPGGGAHRARPPRRQFVGHRRRRRAVLIGNAEIGKQLGLKPRARIRSFASIGSEPTIMLTGPAYSAARRRCSAPA
jgi:acetyl-CoA C-acetyltransferase